MGPPMTKRPVGLTWILVFLSNISAGMTGLMTSLMMASLSVGVRNLFAVLRGDDHGIDARRAAADVFDGDLGFAIGAEEIDYVLLADFGKLEGELMRQLDGHGHQLGRFVAGVAEHQALVARAAGVDAHGDVGRLRLDAGEDAAGVGVKAVLRARVANVANHLAGNILVFEMATKFRLDGDFAGDDDQAGGEQRFAADAAHADRASELRRERRRKSGRQFYRGDPR